MIVLFTTTVSAGKPFWYEMDANNMEYHMFYRTSAYQDYANSGEIDKYVNRMQRFNEPHSAISFPLFNMNAVRYHNNIKHCYDNRCDWFDYPNYFDYECRVETRHGSKRDVDCDGIPDRDDNCEFTPNSNQADMNNNDVGDACDISFKQLVIQPDPVEPGWTFTAHAVLTNNAPFKMPYKLTLSVGLPEIGVHTTAANIPFTGKGSEIITDLVQLTIPRAVRPGVYDVIFQVLYDGDSVLTEIRPLQIGMPMVEPVVIMPISETVLEPIEIEIQTAVEGTSVISLANFLDVAVGKKGVVYPITIENLDAFEKTYTLSVEDIDGWGGFSISPGKTITIAGNDEETAYLYLTVYNPDAVGQQQFNVNIDVGDEQKMIGLTANVIDSANKQHVSSGGAIPWLTVIIVLLIIVAAVIIALISNRKKSLRKPKKTIDFDDIETFY